MNQIKKLVIGVFFLSFTVAKAQLSGTLTVPGTYTSIAAAINDVNTLGVSGPLTFNISAGYTETAPIGGYTLSATGTLANPIIFRKNGVGVNPLITAFTGGTGTPGSAAQDGIFSLIGSDYITIDGINLIDPNIANPATMEYGYGLFKSSANDGCQNNIIKNCLITLNRENNASGTAPSVDGSRGINVVNALFSAQTTVLTVASASGSNSNNQFFTNTIENCNIGIALIGFADVSPFTFADFGNNIGGASSVTGNIIRNFGGATLATNPSAAVRTLAQYNVNVSYNTINNNNGAGVNHVSTLRGIYLNTAVSANSSVNNNTLTLQFGGTTSQVSVIEHISGATAASNTISISNNLITNCTNSLTTTGVFYGIYNSAASAANLVITNNTFTNNTSNATSGATYLIYNSGAIANNLNISNNNLSHSYTGAAAYTGALYNIYNSAGSILTTANINNNIFSSYNHVNVTGTGSIYFVYNLASCLNLSINSNLFNGLTFNHSAGQYYLYNSSSTQSVLTVSSNSITNITRNAAAGTMYCYYAGSSSLPTSTQTFSNNLFSNITATLSGTGLFYGLYTLDGATSPYPKKTFTNNVISNINYNTTGTFYGLYLSYLGDGSTSSGSTISNNKLDNITVSSSTFYGLYNSGTASPNYPLTVSQNTVSNITCNGAASTIYASYVGGAAGGTNFFKNKVYDITSNGATGTVYGLYATTSPTTTIYNNLIGNLYAPNTTGDSKVNGLYIAAGTLINAYYNTVYIPAASTSTSSLFGSNAVYASTTTTVNLRNNVFANLSVPVGLGYTAAYRRSSATLTSYASTSNNNLFYAGIPSANNLIYFDGTTGQSILSAYKGVVAPMDGLSVTENPPFISTVGSASNFLNLNTGIATQIEAGAQTIPGITSDYIGTVRNISTPDIGAWEGSFTPVVVCSGAPIAGSISGASAICVGNVTTLVLLGASTGPGISYQWASSTVSGGPYTTLLGTAGAQTVSPTVSPTYYAVNVVCAASSLTTTTTQFSVSVNPLPVVVATPSVSSYCYPTGTPVSLNASGASTYTWLPTSGLSASTGSAVIASPSGTTIYTVTATNINGCVNTKTATVNVGISVSLDSISATPKIICIGGNSILNAFSSIPTFTYCQASYSSGTTAGDYLGFVSLNTLTNTTVGSAAPYYTLYPQIGATTTTLVAGNTYTINLIAGTYSNNDIAAFIDYGQNGVLDDIGDKLGEVDNLAAAPTATTIVFTVPFTAINGTTRFRVREMDHATVNDITPCLVQSSFGETEDYSITIIGGVNNAVTYTWSPSTYLSATTGSSVSATSVSLTTVYTVTVTNSFGCSNTATKTLSVSPNPTLTVSSGSICSGNSYTITPSGASTYTYSGGSAVVSPTANTSYSVTGTNSVGCIATNTAVSSVTVYAKPTVTAASSSSTVCNGTSAVLSASTAATTYTWNTGATTMTTTVSPSVTTIYTVTVTNAASCAASSTVSINVNPSPTLSVTSGAICSGNSYTMVASGATTYTYSSGTAIVTPTANTSYSVTGTNTFGCISNIAAISNVTVNAIPTVTATTTNSIICVGEVATLNASTSASSYTWNTGATTLSTTVSPTLTTTYSINVTNVNGCNGNSNVTVTVNACVGLNELVSETLSVFPNPNTGVLNIALPASISQNSTLEIYDAIGKLVVKHTLTNELNSVNISDLTNGIYLFKILNNNNSVKIGKLVKQ